MFWFKACGFKQPATQRVRRLRLVLQGVGLLLAMLGGSRLVHAEPSASDRATARALAGEGYVALKEKDYATAEDRFRRADELIHAPTLVVDHARALIGLGRFGEAYAAYESVMKEVIPANAPAVWKVAVKNAEREIQAIKPRVAWLTIQVTGAAEAHVEVDGRVLPPEALGQRRPENPGERSFVVSAPGFISQEEKRLLAEGADTTLHVELLPEPKPAPIVVTKQVVSSPREGEAERKGNPHRVLTYVSFGVSAAGLATGAVAGILWLKLRGDIISSCGGLVCNAQNDSEASRQRADKRRYDTLGSISGVGFAVGIAGAAAGTALLLFQPNAAADSTPKSTRLTPFFGPTSLGVAGTF
jgi:tetratricopeptide (TPR) repeat protein